LPQAHGLSIFKPPYVRMTALNLNDGTRAWMVPLGDGPRQKVIDMGVPDPGPLGGGAYTGPLVTKTLLFVGLRGSEAADLVFAPTTAAVADIIESRARDVVAPPELRALDKRTGATVASVRLEVPPTGSPMTYMANGRQFIVLAYGTGSNSGVVGLALE
jgi:quinoprotein glucose dehydrogenase